MIRSVSGVRRNACSAGSQIDRKRCSATRDAASITQYLNDIRPTLDIDGNGRVDALTDGLLLLRYLFGLRDGVLIANALDPAATRTTSAAIESYIQGLLP